MSRSHLTALAFLSTGLALGSGCSSLPDYARPRSELVDVADLPQGDLISYRALRREDFQGTEPPAAIAPYREEFGAYTCGILRPVATMGISVSRVAARDGTVAYQAVPVGIAFEAAMDRSCSWWNDANATPAGYVLEHEQIHFALFELRARRLNAQADAIRAEATAVAETPAAAQAAVDRKLRDILAENSKAAVAEHLRFDEDTSGGRRPERQKAWRERVEAELRAGASPPS